MPALQDYQMLPNGECLFYWADDHRSVWQPKSLRLVCPCAACVDEWTRERKVVDSQIAEDLKIVRLEKVGRYAVQIYFSDGHSTGLYSEDYLRSLCRCNQCRDSQAASTPQPPCKEWVQ